MLIIKMVSSFCEGNRNFMSIEDKKVRVLDQKNIEQNYKIICDYHANFLKKYGVKLPKLKDTKGNFTKDALVLVYLADNYPNTKKVSKEELTEFIRSFYPRTNDVQQARHLGAQSGWWIAAGGRDNMVLTLKRGDYQLYTLEEPYPMFMQGHRITETDDWEKIKQNYKYRCATCGSKEGELNFHWPATKTVLEAIS